MSRILRPSLLLIILSAFAWTGCFGPLAKRLADKEVFGIIGSKRQDVLKEEAQQVTGTPNPITIDPTTTTLTSDIMHRAGYSSEQFTTNSLILGLPDALALAVDNNRDYKTQREKVYLAALDLTAERHNFSPIFSGTVAEKATRQPGSRVVVLPTGETATVGTVDRFGQTAANIAVTKLFATGARITVGLTTNFLRYYSGPSRPDTASGLLTATAVQPLLQGAGTLVTLENLRQADRDVIYSLRTFERYQRRFMVDRITQYYRLLQAYDEIENEFQAYRRLVVARERAQAMEEAQRMAAFEVDQARQDEIKARNRWLIARTDYALKLDQFKVDLGMPPELNVQPDMAVLAKVEKMNLVELQYGLPDAEEMAVLQRLDYKTALDQAEDAARRVRIAENSLLPAVNAQGALSMPDNGKNRPLKLDWEQRTYSGGLSVELPLDRLNQRNDYRTALIEREQARRDAEQLRNQLIAQVRQAYQNVAQARQSYEIQLAGLELAKRRVDNVQMLLDIAREGVSIRDQLEAQSALRDARNAVTQVLVDYVISRLEFYHAIEALKIDERGIWNHDASNQS